MTPKAPGLAGPAWAVAAMLIWSGWFAVTRLGFSHALTGFDVVALRLMGGTVGMLPLLLRSRLRRRDWLEGAMLSVCWGAPFLMLLTFGIQHTSAGHAAAITPGTTPVFALLLAWALDGRAPGSSQVLGTGLILAGVVVLLSVLPAHDAEVPWGEAALLGAALLWATYGWRLRRSGLQSGVAAAMVAVLSAIVYLPLYALSGVQHLTSASASELAAQIVYQAFLVGIGSLIAFNKAVQAMGASAASAVISLVPVVAMALAGPILNEWPTLIQALAAAAITTGVLATARTPRARYLPES